MAYFVLMKKNGGIPPLSCINFMISLLRGGICFVIELADNEDVHTASHDDGEDEEGDKSETDSPEKEMPSKMAILAATPHVQPKVQLAEPPKGVSLNKIDKLQKTSSLEELENLGGLPGIGIVCKLCHI